MSNIANATSKVKNIISCELADNKSATNPKKTKKKLKKNGADTFRHRHPCLICYLRYINSLVLVKEIMSDPVLLVLDNRIYIDILDTSENVGFHERIGLLQLCDQLLCFQTFA